MSSHPPSSGKARPRIALATLYDEAYAPVGWMCRNALARYGKRHGHDVVVAKSAEMDRPAAWAKVRLVQSLFEQGYDHVFWIDADALIIDPSHDVADLITDSKDMHLVQHPLPWYSAPAPNTGVFLIRNCDWSRDLLKRMWDLDQYAEGIWWENAAFIHLMGLRDFQEQGIDPARCEIDTSRMAWLPERWNRLHLKQEPGATIIRHYAGKSRKHRLRHMMARLNWTKAIAHELTRKPRPLDLSQHGVLGGSLEHAAGCVPTPTPLQQAA